VAAAITSGSAATDCAIARARWPYSSVSVSRSSHPVSTATSAINSTVTTACSRKICRLNRSRPIKLEPSMPGEDTRIQQD
jgi:metal-dependent HD superfamily phosphatase/phosphodiesterase